MGTRRCHAGLPECCRWEESADEMARFERTVTPSVVNMLLLKGPAGRGVKRACRKGTIETKGFVVFTAIRAARTQAKIHFLINDHQPELRPVFLCSLIYRQNFERRLFRKRLPALHMSRHGEKIETGKDNY